MILKALKDRRALKNLLRITIGTAPTQLKRGGVSERQLINRESAIGRELFGLVPKGGKREFFFLDEKTIIWYESWLDPADGRRYECTTRYEVHPHCVLKIQDGQAYKEVTGQELYNLVYAADQYARRVLKEVYHRSADTAPEPEIEATSTAAPVAQAA